MKINAQLLANQPFLHKMPKSQLKVLMEDAMFDEFPANEVIFKQGAPANWFYLILNGQVALESSNPCANNGGEPIRMHTIGAGEVLGWSWLYPPYSWQFTARTLTPVKTIFFYGSRLRERSEEDHELGYELMKRTAETAVRRLQVTRQRILELQANANPMARKPEHKPAAVLNGKLNGKRKGHGRSVWGVNKR